MAKIIVPRGQQEKVRREHPKPAYSRIVNVQANVSESYDAKAFGFSPPLGDTLWLLHVDLWIINPTVDIMIDGLLYLCFGNTKPSTAEEMLESWEMAIRTYGGDVPGIAWTGIREHFSWNITRLFLTKQWRFGLVIVNLMTLTEWGALASFEFSEG